MCFGGFSISGGYIWLLATAMEESLVLWAYQSTIDGTMFGGGTTPPLHSNSYPSFFFLLLNDN